MLGADAIKKGAKTRTGSRKCRDLQNKLGSYVERQIMRINRAHIREV